MAGSERSLLIKFVGESKSLEDAAGQVDRAVGGVGVSLGKLAEGAAFAKVTQAMIGFAKDSVSAALEDKQAQEQLALALRGSVDATEEQIAAVEESIGKLQDETGVLDDELRPAFSALVRATKDTADATRLMSLANDVAIGKGKDLGSVSDALAKAYQGNMKGLKDLGVELKNADGSAKSFNDISVELVALYGGAAKTAFDADPAKRLQVQLENLKETVGTALLPVITTLAGVAENVLGFFNELSPVTQQLIVYVGLLGGAGMSAVKSFSSLSSALGNLKVPTDKLGMAMGAAGIAIIGMTLRAEGAADSAAKLAGHIEALNTVADRQVVAEYGLAIGNLIMKGNGAGDAMAYMARENLEGSKRVIELMKASGDYADQVPAIEAAIRSEEAARAQASTTMDRYGESTADVTAAAEELAEQQRLEEEALRAATKAAEDAEKAQRDFNDAKLASIDATYAIKAAQDQFTESLEALGVAVDDPKTGVNELTQAQDAAALAALAMAAAEQANAEKLAEVAGAPLDAAASNQVLIDSLYRTVLSLDEDSPVRKALIDHIKTLQGVPATKNTAVTATGTEDAATRIGGVKRAIDDVKAETKTDSKADVATAIAAIDKLTVAIDGVPDGVTLQIGVPDVGPAIAELDRLARKLDEVQRKADKLEGTMNRVAG